MDTVMCESMELYHHGIKGMRWGIRRTPEQLGYKANSNLKKIRSDVKKDNEYDKESEKAPRSNLEGSGSQDNEKAPRSNLGGGGSQDNVKAPDSDESGTSENSENIGSTTSSDLEKKSWKETIANGAKKVGDLLKKIGQQIVKGAKAVGRAVSSGFNKVVKTGKGWIDKIFGKKGKRDHKASQDSIRKSMDNLKGRVPSGSRYETYVDYTKDKRRVVRVRAKGGKR